ncbi:MAG: GNAT family N-acetyltransferase [Pseudomonadota bacterium]
MSKLKLRIDPYNRKYRGGVIACLKVFWQLNDEMAERFFAWKYEDNPWSTRIHLVLLLDGEEVVGMRGACPLPIHAPNREPLMAAMVGDSFIVSKYRGGREFFQMTRMLLQMMNAEGISYALNASATAPVRRVSVREGWTDTGSFPVLEYNNTSKLRTDSGLASLDPLLEAWQPVDNGWIHMSSKFYVGALTTLQSNQKPVALEVERNDLYWRWRPLNPRIDYRVMYLFDSSESGSSNSNQRAVGALRAAIVIGVDKALLANRVWIAGWITRDSGSLRDLLAYFFEINPFKTLYTMAPAGPAAGSFSSVGFVQSRNSAMDFRILIRSTDTQPADSEWVAQMSKVEHWQHHGMNLDEL